MRQLFLGDHLQRHYFVPLVHQVGLELLFEPETDTLSAWCWKLWLLHVGTIVNPSFRHHRSEGLPGNTQEKSTRLQQIQWPLFIALEASPQRESVATCFRGAHSLSRTVCHINFLQGFSRIVCFFVIPLRGHKIAQVESGDMVQTPLFTKLYKAPTIPGAGWYRILCISIICYIFWYLLGDPIGWSRRFQLKVDRGTLSTLGWLVVRESAASTWQLVCELVHRPGRQFQTKETRTRATRTNADT